MIAFIPLLLLATATPGRVDSICGAHCEILAVQHGRVMLIDEWPPARTVDLGKYDAEAQRLVPANEAPVFGSRSARGWHVVGSIYMSHSEDETRAHVRFLGPNGTTQDTADILLSVQQTRIGALFGGSDEIFAVTSWEEHAYNVQTQIWLLPSNGTGPGQLLVLPGVFQRFSDGSSGSVAGVAVARQTYDGEHAETKGSTAEFYAWDSASKSLSLQKR